MAKIYRRSNMVSGVTPKKKDKIARKRNVIMNFRVSEQEKVLINQRIALSGLSKSDYFINSCINNKIMVSGNVKTFNVIKDAMMTIDRHLCQLSKTEELDEEVLQQLRMVLEILDGMYGEEVEMDGD